MKFYKVIRYWAKAKYKLTSSDLDLLFFIYSEGLFSKTDFDFFTRIYAWDTNRFKKLLKEGWIRVWRKPNKQKREKALYDMSYKGKKVIASIYDKMLGTETSDQKPNNPMFYAKASSYSNKVHRDALIAMNKEYRETNPKLKNGRPANIPF
jgi:hypothetical protein